MCGDPAGDRYFRAAPSSAVSNVSQLKTEDRIIALSIAVIYILYPAVGFISRFDYHVEVLAIPAFIAALIYDGKRTLGMGFGLACRPPAGFGAKTEILGVGSKTEVATRNSFLFFLQGDAFQGVRQRRPRQPELI